MQFAEIRGLPLPIRGLSPRYVRQERLAITGRPRYTESMMDYKVVRTDRKTLALMVRKNGELEVRAPLHTTEEHIAAFVQAHEDWARKHVARVLDSPPPQTEEDIAALKARARAVLPGKTAHYGAILGLQPSAIRITETRSRYGSCSSRKVISFSCFLMLLSLIHI